MPFIIDIEQPARDVLDRAPRRSRHAIERCLREAARLASLRQWMHASEAQEPCVVVRAGYQGTYSVDLENRRLTLLELRPLTPEPRQDTPTGSLEEPRETKPPARGAGGRSL